MIYWKGRATNEVIVFIARIFFSQQVINISMQMACCIAKNGLFLFKVVLKEKDL